MKRTTIEIDEQLLARAKRVLGQTTTRATVEEALRRATESAEDGQAVRAELQMQFFGRLGHWADLDVLGSEDMWR